MDKYTRAGTNAKIWIRIFVLHIFDEYSNLDEELNYATAYVDTYKIA